MLPSRSLRPCRGIVWRPEQFFQEPHRFGNSYAARISGRRWSYSFRHLPLLQMRLKVEKEPYCVQKESPVSSFRSDATSAVPTNTPTSLGVDRRVWVRYFCDLESTCHSGKGPDEVSWSARVLDISRGGLSLQLNRAFEPGSILSVDIPLGPNLAPRSLLVKVVHAKNQGPGNWSLGCALEKNLDEEDLLAFQVKKPVKTAG